MANPASSDALMAFQWKGKRLAMTFEGGLSTSSYRRACNRREAPEGYAWDARTRAADGGAGGSYSGGGSSGRS
jgi:hypothetical protein